MPRVGCSGRLPLPCLNPAGMQNQATQTHAALANLPWLHEHNPENDLWINHDEAARMGIRTGDMLEVSSTAGTVRIKARVTEEIRPDCVFMLHGFGKKSPWLKSVYNVGAADSVLLETAWDKVSGNAAMHETFVKVVRV